MLQRVGPGLSRRRPFQRLHEGAAVSGGHGFGRTVSGIGQEPPQKPQVPLAVGQKGELVGRVEVPERRQRRPLASECAPFPVSVHALDEVPAQRRIVEAALGLDGQERNGVRQRLGEQPASRVPVAAGLGVNGDPLRSATRRPLLEDESAHLQLLDLDRPPAPVAPHGPGPVPAGTLSDHAGRPGLSHQVHGFPRRPHSHLHLRTDGDDLEQPRQCIGDGRVALVAAVPADRVAQEATADADTSFHRHDGSNTCIVRGKRFPHRVSYHALRGERLLRSERFTR